MRDVAGFIPHYIQMVAAFTLRPAVVVIGENDSSDETWNELVKGKTVLESKGIRVVLFSFRTGLPLYRREASRRRSIHLALTRNRVIDEALKHDWRYALMQDAQKYSAPDVPTRLNNLMEDVVDNQYNEHRIGIRGSLVVYPNNHAYDTWCQFEDSGKSLGHDTAEHEKRGYRQVMSVGGVYLVQRKILEAGVRLAGTNGKTCDSVPLCEMAEKYCGLETWMDPMIKTVHCPAPDTMARMVK